MGVLVLFEGRGSNPLSDKYFCFEQFVDFHEPNREIGNKQEESGVLMSSVLAGKGHREGEKQKGRGFLNGDVGFE
jgi:hypothetical protein